MHPFSIMGTAQQAYEGKKMDVPTPNFETDLYQQEWLGDELENWLDAIEDIGVFDLEFGENKTAGKRTKLNVECMSRKEEPLENSLKKRFINLKFTANGLDSFELHYQLIVNSSDNTNEEKKVFYSDVDGNDIPSNNFHYAKWCKILNLKS